MYLSVRQLRASQLKNPPSCTLRCKKTDMHPCYHFFLFFPHEKNLCECQTTPSAITGGPVAALLQYTYATLVSNVFCRSVHCSEAMFPIAAFSSSQLLRRWLKARHVGRFSVKAFCGYSLRHCVLLAVGIRVA